MKHSKVLGTLGVFILFLHAPSFAQEVLPGVTVKAVTYKYLNAVDHKDLAQPVKLLERRAAEYDIKNTDYYEEDYDTYFVSFLLPEGEILASYDKDGKLLSTAERFKDIALPNAVRTAIGTRFPGWTISKDFYLVDYYEDQGAKKVYKVMLENGDKRIRVKTNEKGEFL